MNTAQIEALVVADSHLASVGLLSYAQLLELLNDAARLGLTFDIGSAYIRRCYIDEQTALCARIAAANGNVKP